MFALPNQTTGDVIADLVHSAKLGANQRTTYPFFTFPYTSVGKYLQLTAVWMPDLRVRRAHYRAISEWCMEHWFWTSVCVGVKAGRPVPRYSSVTRDSYIGIGPGAGFHLLDGFAINTFDLNSWIRATCEGCTAIALRMPFAGGMSGWWWCVLVLLWHAYTTGGPRCGPR